MLQNAIFTCHNCKGGLMLTATNPRTLLSFLNSGAFNSVISKHTTIILSSEITATAKQDDSAAVRGDNTHHPSTCHSLCLLLHFL